MKNSGGIGVGSALEAELKHTDHLVFVEDTYQTVQGDKRITNIANEAVKLL